jgi:hypothetical protein
VLVAAGALMASGCGGGDDAAGSGAPTTAPGTTEPAPASDGVAPPPITATTDENETTDAAGTAGDAGDAADTRDTPEILQVSAPLVGGGELDLAAYGDRPLLLWFWAPF